jgi:hypothetical protein
MSVYLGRDDLWVTAAYKRLFSNNVTSQLVRICTCLPLSLTSEEIKYSIIVRTNLHFFIIVKPIGLLYHLLLVIKHEVLHLKQYLSGCKWYDDDKDNLNLVPLEAGLPFDEE